MQRLTLSYAPEDGWHGELTASVQSGGFSGKSAAWFSSDILREFAETLGAFPIAPGKEPKLRGGFWKGDDQLDETHVSICIEPVGPRGSLRARILLATPSVASSGSGEQSVQAQFLINYADLGAFQAAFIAMMDGKQPDACLEAIPT